MNKAPLSVIFYTDLDNSELFEESDFTEFTYGDAVYTVVYAGQLISELEDCESRPGHQPLIDELRALGTEQLICFNG